MNRKHKRLFARAAAFSMAAAMLLATGCSNSKDDGQELVTVIVKSHDQYWETLRLGAEDACEEMGYKLSFLQPENENDAKQQVRYIEQAVSDGSKAIIIAPTSPTSLNSSLESATAEGIPIISIDTDMEYTAKETLISTDQDSAGAIAARAILKALPTGSSFAIVSYNRDSLTATGRIDSLLQNLTFIDKSVDDPEKANEYSVTEDEASKATTPVYKFVGMRYSDNNRKIAETAASKLLDENPDIKIVFCTNQSSTLGVCDAIKNKGLAGRVSVIGFDPNDEEVQYVRDGILMGTIAQNPYNMGYLGVRYADKVLAGEDIPPRIDTGVCYVTKDNLENSDVQLLLNPALGQ